MFPVNVIIIHCRRRADCTCHDFCPSQKKSKESSLGLWSTVVREISTVVAYTTTTREAIFHRWRIVAVRSSHRSPRSDNLFTIHSDIILLFIVGSVLARLISSSFLWRFYHAETGWWMSDSVIEVETFPNGSRRKMCSSWDTRKFLKFLLVCAGFVIHFKRGTKFRSSMIIVKKIQLYLVLFCSLENTRSYFFARRGKINRSF